MKKIFVLAPLAALAFACGDMEKNNEYRDPEDGIKEVGRLSDDEEEGNVIEHVEKADTLTPYGDTISDYKIGVED